MYRTISVGITVILVSLCIEARTSAVATIDSDTTINSPISDGFVEVVDGVSPPTVVDIVDGALVDNMSVLGTSVLNVSGGDVNHIGASDTSVINVSGGLLGSVSVLGGATGEFIGGTLEEEFRARENSTVTISGGTFDDFRAHDFSVVDILGGNFTDELEARDTSTLNIAGGTMPLIVASGSSTVNVRGGTIPGFEAIDSAIVNIFGFDLSISANVLTGRLADGRAINATLLPAANAQYVLHQVPESSALSLAVVGLAALWSLTSSQRSGCRQ